MNGCFLKFYVSEGQRHHHKLVYEWLLEEAKGLGLPGGSAFRALAGFGRHGRLHEANFFELAGDLPVEVGFVLTSAQADRFIEHLAGEALDLFYVRLPVQFGWTLRGDAAARD
ncbi:MAG: DUF190 domain-containing protein [Sphingobacteriia bacterium]|nr:DUF190 domain-containing protein [Sphingobacteriia bacterium]NCC39996.1 DUF190 domain-containing protein [Gammaproteobacteria bacterium]